MNKTNPYPKYNLLGHGRRMLALITLVILLLLTISQVSPAKVPVAATPERFLVELSLTPTPTLPATSTSKPAATKTPQPLPSTDPIVRVSGYSVNLRSGPGMNYPVVRKLDFGEELIFLGRMDDNSWLYLKTSGGQEGWSNHSYIDLTGIDVDAQQIKTPVPYPDTIVRVSVDQANLRTGPGTIFPKVRKLEYKEPLMVLGRYSDFKWLYIKTSDGLEGWVDPNLLELGSYAVNYHDRPVITSPPTPTSTPVILPGVEGPWIDIDLSDQTLYAYDGSELKASFLVSTGVRDYPTEPGQYHIQVKYRYDDMRGNDYFLPDVPYTMYYDGDFAIHGTYWHHSFGTPMSRGCVNMDPGDSAWLFTFASVGTLVNIHR